MISLLAAFSCAKDCPEGFLRDNDGNCLQVGESDTDTDTDSDTDADADTDTDTDTDADADADTDADTDADADTDPAALLDPTWLDATWLTSATEIDCDLEDGSHARCWELVFAANPVVGGPYCPLTVDEIGGLGVYDGTTGPGLRQMDGDLFLDMEADGWDIVDDDGNVRIQDPAGGPPPPMGGPPPPPGSSYCLEATADDTLELVFRIPAVPALLATPDAIDDVELAGMSLDGAPLNGPPPSVVDTMGNIPALDPCGGHIDPSGYYHRHFVAQSVNTLLAIHELLDVTCTETKQDAEALVGFAKDGHPMYATHDAGGVVPKDLDACSGHTGPTAHFPKGVYHYHALPEGVPSTPPCVVGVEALGSFEWR